MLIAASTGGPAPLEAIVSSINPSFNATIIIAQHMGDEFIPSFTHRLEQKSPIPLLQSSDNLEIKNSTIYVVSKDSTIQTTSRGVYFSVKNNTTSRFNPDIDTLFLSAVDLTPKYDFLTVILSGIGHDGVNGAVALAQKGVKCLAANMDSCVVYGMSARASERVSGVEVLSLESIIKKILSFGA